MTETQQTGTFTRVIRMTAERRGGLGEGKYRTFTEGETYVVDAAGTNGVPAFLAEQFLKAGEAKEVALGALATTDAGAPADGAEAPATKRGRKRG